MREALKVLCVVVLMFAAPAAAVAWIDDQTGLIITILRYACPVFAVLAIATFLKLHFRADEMPDYLRREIGTYFNRGGLCFNFRATAIEGVCYLDVHFQNQTDAPCLGRIALRPARGFFLGRAKMDTILVEVSCDPAAYGVARVPIPIPANLQGKRHSFEVGASVDYPQGKGRLLRFHDGIALRANSRFGNAFGTTLMVAGAMTGQIVIASPATVTLDLPANVAEQVSDGQNPEVKTLWRLGDPLEFNSKSEI
jgi:hypothetical protein